MGVINLKRNQGINVTNKSNTGVSAGGYDSLSRSVENVNRANQNLARGISHVGNALFQIWNDQADIRNRQELLEGETQLFDLSNAQEMELNKRLESGEFDGEGGFEKFKQACGVSQGKIIEELDKWSDKNITSSVSRDNLRQVAILDGKETYARFAGNFIRHDNNRRWNMFVNQTDRAIKQGNFENLKLAFNSYVGLIKDKNGNDVSTKKSKEFSDNLWADLEYKFDKQQVDNIVEESKLLTSDESVMNFATDVEKKIQSGEIKINDKNLQKKTLSYVDKIFNIANENSTKEIVKRYDAIEKAYAQFQKEKARESERAKSLERKRYLKEVDNIVSQYIGNLTFEQLSPLYGEKKKKIESYKGKIPDEELEGKLIELDHNFKKSVSTAVENSQNLKWDKLVQTVGIALKNNGEIDAQFFSQNIGKDNIEEIRQMQKSSLGNTQNDLLEYRKKSNALFDDIFNLRKNRGDLKEYSSYVAELVAKTQGLNAEDRKRAIQLLNHRVNNTPPPEWTPQAWRGFLENLDKTILWNDDIPEDDTKTRDLYDSFEMALVAEIKNRAIKDTVSASEYVNNHPIYKNLLGKKSANLVEIMLKGIAPTNPLKEWKSMSTDERRKKVLPWAREKITRWGGGVPSDFSEKYISEADIKAYELEKFYGKK